MHWDINPLLRQAESDNFGMNQAREQISDLAKVIDISKNISKEKDLNKLFEMLVKVTTEVLKCERTTLFLVDENTRELYSLVAEKSEIKEIRFSPQKGIAGFCATANTPVNVENAYEDSRFNPEIDMQTGYQTKNLLCYPLSNFEGKVIGVLQSLNKISGKFTDYDESLLAAFSHQAAVALDNARLAQTYLEKEKLKKSMEIAKEVQQSLLPKTPPSIEGLDIFASCVSCDETGGDYFDFINIDKHKIGLAIGDVSGHGIGAALFMGMSRMLLRTFGHSKFSPNKIMADMNSPLVEDMGESFMTLFYGILDVKNWEMEYSSAGHDEPIIVRNDSKSTTLPSTTLPLGMLPDIEIESEYNVKFYEGDLLVLTTDGIWEAIDQHGKQFSRERLIKLIKDNKHLNSQDLVRTIEKTVRDYIHPLKFIDDYSLVVIKFVQQPKVEISQRFLELEL